jgi:hypothetical protein
MYARALSLLLGERVTGRADTLGDRRSYARAVAGSAMKRAAVVLTLKQPGAGEAARYSENDCQRKCLTHIILPDWPCLGI